MPGAEELWQQAQDADRAGDFEVAEELREEAREAERAEECEQPGPSGCGACAACRDWQEQEADYRRDD